MLSRVTVSVLHRRNFSPSAQRSKQNQCGTCFGLAKLSRPPCGIHNAHKRDLDARAPSETSPTGFLRSDFEAGQTAASAWQRAIEPGTRRRHRYLTG